MSACEKDSNATACETRSEHANYKTKTFERLQEALPKPSVHHCWFNNVHQHMNHKSRGGLERDINCLDKNVSMASWDAW